ncbi:CHAT domain-containing protein [Hydrogenophaga sp. ZJX-1]|uniref:CHAT domain-containing protein n=1 Tax=Hydrogenophaga sp. ZJX-1 TaxID=3404778 RepID=UPI003B281AC3
MVWGSIIDYEDSFALSERYACTMPEHDISNGPRDRSDFFNQVFIDASAAAGSKHLQTLIEVFAEGAKRNRSNAEAALGWQFAQFVVGAVGARSALSRYELNEAGDWLAWSLTESIEHGSEQHLEVGRLVSFINPMIYKWEHFANIYVGWYSDFYYYALRRAAMPEIGKALLPNAIRVVEMMWRKGVYETLATAASNLLAWSVQEFPEAVPQIAPLVVAAANDPSTDGRARLLLAMTLAGRPGRVLEVDHDAWRNLALHDLSDWHRQHDRLQLLVEEFGSRDDRSVFDEVVREIDRYQGWAGEHASHNVDAYRGLDALAPLVGVALNWCLARRQSDRVMELLSHWYRVPHGESFEAADLLIQSPFHSDGYVALFGTEEFHIDGDTQGRLIELTKASNKFLGVFHSVAGASDETPHVPDRQGVVDVNAGGRFEAQLSETYLPAGLAAKSWDFSGQVFVPTKAHPIQAMQVSCRARSAPIVASLRKPRPDRKVRRVAIWSGAGSMTEEIERELVAATFRKGGAHVEVVAAKDASIGDFLKLYEEDSFDVIWFMSHGTFEHFSPKKASLVVDSIGKEVGIAQILTRTPNLKDRRLLVLNVCDGGRFEELGILPRVGVAPAAASASQATVSHLWPVHGISAAAFGVVFASHLASQPSFFDAFTRTLEDLYVHKDNLADLVRCSVGGDASQLVDRIERSNIDFTNIAHWGSSVFYC